MDRKLSINPAIKRACPSSQSDRWSSASTVGSVPSDVVSSMICSETGSCFSFARTTRDISVVVNNRNPWQSSRASLSTTSMPIVSACPTGASLPSYYNAAGQSYVQLPCRSVYCPSCHVSLWQSCYSSEPVYLVCIPMVNVRVRTHENTVDNRRDSPFE
jgi:hypothetical protein